MKRRLIIPGILIAVVSLAQEETADAAVPIQPGTQIIEAGVQVTWQIQ